MNLNKYSYLNKPINVFENSSNFFEHKIDTFLFVQKPYLRTNYIEPSIEENIDFKNQFRIKNIPDPISIREATSKNYVDNLFEDPSILKNTARIDLNDRNITKARFIRVNQLPQIEIDSHLTAKLFVDNAIDEPSLVRNNQDNDFNKYNLTDIISISVNTQAVNDNQVFSKAHVDHFHQENERFRRDLGISFYNEEVDLLKKIQDNSFNDNKLTNINSITINNNPNADNHVSNKKYVDDFLDKNTTVTINQTLLTYLKVSVGNNTYNLTKYNKINITVITEIRNLNTGQMLLQKRILKCLNKSYNAKINTFLKSTMKTSPTAESGASSLPPIGWSFKFVESSSNNHAANHIMVSWERTDIIQMSNIKIYYNRISTSDQNFRGIGRFRIQLLLEDNSWSTIHKIHKFIQFSSGSTQWYLFDADIT